MRLSNVNKVNCKIYEQALKLSNFFFLNFSLAAIDDFSVSKTEQYQRHLGYYFTFFLQIKCEEKFLNCFFSSYFSYLKKGKKKFKIF